MKRASDLRMYYCGASGIHSASDLLSSLQLFCFFSICLPLLSSWIFTQPSNINLSYPFKVGIDEDSFFNSVASPWGPHWVGYHPTSPVHTFFSSTNQPHWSIEKWILKFQIEFMLPCPVPATHKPPPALKMEMVFWTLTCSLYQGIKHQKRPA